MRRFLAAISAVITSLTITGTLAAQAKPDTTTVRKPPFRYSADTNAVAAQPPDGLRIIRSGPNRTLYRVDTLAVKKLPTGQCNWAELRLPSHPPNTYGQFLPRDEQACTVVHFLLLRPEPVRLDTARATPDTLAKPAGI